MTGALFTHLAPTAIALPSYFCLADLILIAQCVYYNHRNRRKASKQPETAEAAEDSPLLRRQDSPSHQQSNGYVADATADSLTKDASAETETGGGSQWVNNTLSMIAVWVIGAVAWFISYKAGAWDAGEPAPDAPDEVNNPLEMAGLTLGYISAVCYLW